MTLLSPIPEPASPAPQRLETYDVRRLTGPSGLAHLVLDGQTYTLRITRAGKLILTK
ncbi:hemin uptake protein HemP [Frigidibacter sp. ROC022]|uniref:hemin uptake protein HemP n=1 Tax=Frigidibacter sp. ROC022 TaxID=2971796 RepID=UPI00215A4529|nr:hemin uptake protein HemP [Frigidibacter sp. ROC022]MCR8723312.1 hemin uptake protein HemP [Frigidibacter sp. ROC022]